MTTNDLCEAANLVNANVERIRNRIHNDTEAATEFLELCEELRIEMKVVDNTTGQSIHWSKMTDEGKRDLAVAVFDKVRKSFLMQ